MRLRAVCLTVVTMACAGPPELPTAPSELLTGIVVYQHANFLGASAHITEGISDLRDFEGPCQGQKTSFEDPPEYSWNDCISSVRVAPGWSATLYRDDRYRDDAISITADIPNLQVVPHDCPRGCLNDCVTSVRVWRLP